MDCAAALEAMSAALDDELGDVERRALDAHAAACPACRAARVEMTDLHRLVRVRAADDVPDLVEPIMASVRLPARPRTRDLEWARYALLAVALTQLVLALPALLLGEDGGASIHVARELGSFDAALAAGMLIAAWQPRRAAGLLPFAAALAAAMAITATVDLVTDRAVVTSEAHHVLDLVGLVLLWLVAKDATRPVRRSGQVRLA